MEQEPINKESEEVKHINNPSFALSPEVSLAPIVLY